MMLKNNITAWKDTEYLSDYIQLRKEVIQALFFKTN